MREKMLFILIMVLVFLIQLSAVYFFRISGAMPSFLVIMIFLGNLFYERFYKINLFLALIFGFILDVFSILPFGFWMIILFVFFIASNFFINYFINKEVSLNALMAIFLLMLFYEASKFLLLKSFYAMGFITYPGFSFAELLIGLVYNFSLCSLLYFIIRSILAKLNKYEYTEQAVRI